MRPALASVVPVRAFARKEGVAIEMATIEAPPVHRIALIQLVFLLVLAGLCLPWDVTVAYSVLIGGIVQIGPQAYFTRFAFRFAGARQAPQIMRAMYKGESGKLLLTAVLFALTFFFVKPLHLPALFLSYSAMIIIQWFFAAKALNR